MKRAFLLLIAAWVMFPQSLFAQTHRPAEEKQRKLEQTTHVADRAKNALTWEFIVRRALDDTDVTGDWRETDINDIARELADKGGINIFVDPLHRRPVDINGRLPVTLSVRNGSLREALRQVAEKAGMKVVIADGAVVLTDRNITPLAWPRLAGFVDARLDEVVVTCDLREQPLSAIVALLAKRANLDLRCDTAIKVSLRTRDMQLRHLLNWLARFRGLRFKTQGDALVIAEAPLPANDIAFRRLRETIVSFTFDDQPYKGAFAFLSTLGNVNILIEQEDLGRNTTLTLKLNNVRLETALKLCAEQLGMKYALRGGVVYIAPQKRLDEIAKHDAEVSKRFADLVAAGRLKPDDVRTKKQLDDVIVSFTFNEQPAKEALEFLQTLGNLNIVTDRKAYAPEKTAVTLKLTNVPLRIAMVLIAEQSGMRCALRDGVVMFYSDKDLAESGAVEVPID